MAVFQRRDGQWVPVSTAAKQYRDGQWVDLGGGSTGEGDNTAYIPEPYSGFTESFTGTTLNPDTWILSPADMPPPYLIGGVSNGSLVIDKVTNYTYLTHGSSTNNGVNVEAVFLGDFSGFGNLPPTSGANYILDMIVSGNLRITIQGNGAGQTTVESKSDNPVTVSPYIDLAVNGYKISSDANGDVTFSSSTDGGTTWTAYDTGHIDGFQSGSVEIQTKVPIEGPVFKLDSITVKRVSDNTPIMAETFSGTTLNPIWSERTDGAEPTSPTNGSYTIVNGAFTVTKPSFSKIVPATRFELTPGSDVSFVIDMVSSYNTYGSFDFQIAENLRIQAQKDTGEAYYGPEGVGAYPARFNTAPLGTNVCVFTMKVDADGTLHLYLDTVPGETPSGVAGQMRLLGINDGRKASVNEVPWFNSRGDPIANPKYTTTTGISWPYYVLSPN